MNDDGEIMNIEKMSKKDKSVFLFSLIGWIVEEPITHVTGSVHIYATEPKSGTWLRICDGNTLYDAKNMALSWSVFNWAGEYLDDFLDWFAMFDAPTESAEVVLRVSLDTILEQAIAQGKIE